MRHVWILASITTAALAATACDGGSSRGNADTTASGAASYEDAATDAEGQPREPARPARQPASDPLRISIRAEGTGNLSGLETRCAAESLAGRFVALLSGEAELSDGGLFAAGMISSEAEVLTPGGCPIPELQVSAFTEVIVRGEISATTLNCDAYCRAKARAHGEAECSGNGSQASCRAAAEAEYLASCNTSCTASTTTVIAAETRLSAQSVADLSSRRVTGMALGEIEVDLVFDRIENASGGVVSER